MGDCQILDDKVFQLVNVCITIFHENRYTSFQTF